jgi:hypothetical protein
MSGCSRCCSGNCLTWIRKDPQTFLTYKRIHDIFGLPQKGETFGKSLQRQPMDSLAGILKEEWLPALTVVIVNETTPVPGDGYFDNIMVAYG